MTTELLSLQGEESARTLGEQNTRRCNTSREKRTVRTAEHGAAANKTEPSKVRVKYVAVHADNEKQTPAQCSIIAPRKGSDLEEPVVFLPSA